MDEREASGPINDIWLSISYIPWAMTTRQKPWYGCCEPLSCRVLYLYVPFSAISSKDLKRALRAWGCAPVVSWVYPRSWPRRWPPASHYRNSPGSPNPLQSAQPTAVRSVARDKVVRDKHLYAYSSHTESTVIFGGHVHWPTIHLLACGYEQ